MGPMGRLKERPARWSAASSALGPAGRDRIATWLSGHLPGQLKPCLLYNSDAPDELEDVDLGGRSIK